MFGTLLVEVLFTNKSKDTKAGAASRPEIPSHCPLTLKALLESCWNESAMQSMIDVDKKLDHFVSKWQGREDWTSLEELYEYEKETQDTLSENLQTDSNKDDKITSNFREDSGTYISSASKSGQSQYPLKTIAVMLPSGSSTPESGTFDSVSPITQSPSSTQQPEELKKTITSDYHSPASTQQFTEQGSELVYNNQIAETITGEMEQKEQTEKLTIDSGGSDTHEIKREFASLETGKRQEQNLSEPLHHNSLPERRGFSLPLNVSTTKPHSHSELAASTSKASDRRSPADSITSSSSRKATPPSVTKVVGNAGDKLTLEGLGISLVIPPGALQESREITLTVVLDRNIPHLEKEESNVCPVVRCLPSGLQFNKPVVIRIPHCAVTSTDKPVTANVHCSQEAENDPPKWQKTTSSNKDYPQTDIHSDHLLLSVLHFTDYLVTIEGVLVKKMKLVSFVSEVYDDLDQEIRVYLHNDNITTLQHVCQEEDLINGVKKGPSPPYRIQQTANDAIFQLSRPSVGWILVSDSGTKKIDFSSVWHQDFVVTQFTLERKSDDVSKFRCKVEAWQDQNTQPAAQIEITNPIKRMNNCRESRAQNLQTPPPQTNFLYRQGSRTQMSVSNYGSEGSCSYQSTRQREMLVVSNATPLRTSPPFDTSMESTNSMSLPSSDYYDQMTFQPILPYELERMVCDKLDMDHPLSHDWRMLAARYKLDGHIDRFAKSNSPTREVLKVLQCNLQLTSYQQLIVSLKQISRPDVAKLIEENIRRFYTQPDDNPQLLSNTARPLQGKQYQALEYTEQQQSLAQANLPSNANQPVLRGRAGRPQTTSPPAASTPSLSPDSGTDTVPEEIATTPESSQSGERYSRYPRGKCEVTKQNESHITCSLGPSNVHPAEYDDDIEDDLQVDGVVGDNSSQTNAFRNNSGIRGLQMDNNRNEIETSAEVAPVENLAERLDSASINAT
ncbi:uncharacterized protein [Amphiura filiformis]|uniref:uncharacterized protein n=1 Tax=Amphiura filiformis TaxID=82378 RepID=UPI003B218999